MDGDGNDSRSGVKGSDTRTGVGGGGAFALETDRIGHYRLQQELRRGGMGVVFLAADVDDGDRPVALKMALQADAQSQARFQQEIRATSSLDHPSIVRVRDHGELAGRPWYAMDVVGSTNLADVLAVRGPGAPDELVALLQSLRAGELPLLGLDARTGLPRSTAVALVRDIANAVAHAHARGVLHRDIKPANILISDQGDPVLADFGVARHVDSLLRLTAADEVVGTYLYIAPEQLAGEDIDERADVYALGAVLYECLVGRPPPRRDHGCEPLPLPRDLPVGLRRILAAALEPDPDRRTGGAAALATDLRRFQRGEAVAARGPSWVRRAWYAANRHVVVSALLLALLLTTLLLVTVAQEVERQRAVAWDEVLSLPLEDWPDAARVVQPEGRSGAALVSKSGQELPCLSLSGAWLPGPQGRGLVAETGLEGFAGHYAAGMQVPGHAGLRVEVAATTPSLGQAEVSVFIGQGGQYHRGYTFQLGAYANSCSLLKRGTTVLWMGQGRLEPGRRYTVALERYGGELSAQVDGVEVVRMNDVLPSAGDWCGFFTYGGGAAQVVFETLRVRCALAPARVPADWTVLRLAQLGEAEDAAGPQLQEAALALADDLLSRLDADDPRQDELLLRRGALLIARGRGGDPGHRQRLLAWRLRLQHRVEFHQQVLVSDLKGTDHDATDLIAGHIEQALLHLQHHDDRVRYACWLERELREHLRPALVELLLRNVPPEEPFWHYLSARLVDSAVLGELDLSMQERLMARLAEAPGQSWWQDRVLIELDRRRFLREGLEDRPPGSLLARIQALNPGLTEQQHLVRAALQLGVPAAAVEGIDPSAIIAITRYAPLLEDDLQSMLLLAGRTVTAGSDQGWLSAMPSADQLAELDALAGGVPENAVAWARRWPSLVQFALITAEASQLFAQRMLATLLLLHPRQPLLDELCRIGQHSGRTVPVLVAIAWQLKHRRDCGWFRPNLGPALLATVEELADRPDQVPRLDPPLHSYCGPWLQLAAALRCRELGDDQEADRRLMLLAASPDHWPETRAARRLLAERGQ